MSKSAQAVVALWSFLTMAVALAALHRAPAAPSHLYGFSGPVIDVSQLFGRAQFPHVHSVYEYGAKCDGVTNDATALQAALTAAPGGTLVIPSGATCLSGSQLTLSAGSTIYLARSSKILKTYDAGGGTTLGFFITSGIATNTKQSDILIEGPGTIGCSSAAFGGNIFSVYGDRIVLRDFTIDTYGGGANKGRAILMAGDDDRIVNLRIINPQHAVGAGGIRYVGGNGFVARDNHVESGDDALQFVPIPPLAACGSTPLMNLSITNALYEGNTGISYNARFIAVLTEDTNGSGCFTSNITSVSFIANRGTGNNRVAVIQNSGSSGLISHVNMTDTAMTVGSPSCCVDEMLIDVDDGVAGNVTDITLRKLRIVTPAHTPLRIYGANLARVSIEDADFDAPSDVTKPSLQVDKGSDVTVLRGHFRSVSGAHAILVGNFGGTNVDHFAMYQGVIDGIANTFAGVRLVTTTSASVVGTSFFAATSQATALAVSVNNNSSATALLNLDTQGVVAQGNNAPISDSGGSTTRMGTDSGSQKVSRNWQFTGALEFRSAPTIAAASTMPATISAGNQFFVSAGTGVIDTIPGLTGGFLQLRFTGAVTVDDQHHGGNISLTGGADISAINGTILQVGCFDGTNWEQVAPVRTP